MSSDVSARSPACAAHRARAAGRSNQGSAFGRRLQVGVDPKSTRRTRFSTRDLARVRRVGTPPESITDGAAFGIPTPPQQPGRAEVCRSCTRVPLAHWHIPRLRYVPPDGGAGAARERSSVPEVSVVIAAYNHARWLGQAIDDVQRQTFCDWELVVVDDGSTDSTRAVVARYEGDPRVHYLFQPNQERSAARNRGIAATSGRLLAFLDADDRWVPDKLAKQVAALAASPEAAFCYTPARFVDGSGAPLATRKPPRSVAGWIFPSLVRANLIILASVVARRDRVEEVGGFDAALPVYGCEDWDLWLRLARRHPVAVVDEELTLYRE